MKVGIVILCRYASTRMPGKILSQVQGRSVLGHIIDRLKWNVPDVPLVVATSRESSDDVVASECIREGVRCFRGAHNDVASRFLEAARSEDWEFAIRINGDNLFVDTESIRGMLAIARTNVFDFVTNVPGRKFPKGMSVEIVRTQFLDELLKDNRDPEDREHVTRAIYNNPSIGRRYLYPNTICPEAQGMDLALDTPEDLAQIESIISRWPKSPTSLGLRDVYDLAHGTREKSPWRGKAGPMMIAEIGGNHEGDFEVACSMTESAILAGADCVKFQIYQGDTLVSPVESPKRHKHFQSFELTREQHIALAKMCRDAGVEYLASVWDDDAFEWVDEFLSFYKVGSGDLTAWPLLRRLAQRGKPILLSTGLATLDEVVQAVRFLQSVDDKYRRREFLCVLQCTSMYPIPDEEAHLKVMDRLRESTGLAVGYSDHTVGDDALKVAASMGAEVLEFHFTDTREGKTFRDHKVSLTPEEVKSLGGYLRKIMSLRGNSIKTPQPSELEAGHEVSFRRAAYLNRDVYAGEQIGEQDLVFLRPLHGVDARDADLLIGLTAKRDLQKFHSIDLSRDFN